MEKSEEKPSSGTIKWEGKVSAKIATKKAEQIWGLYKDFFNLHKYFPSLTTSYGLHGSNGVPGCIRYCQGNSWSNSGGRSWSKEELVSVDDQERCLTYQILDSNIGFYGYTSTVRITPVTAGGCVIHWFFSVNPVKGLSLQDLVIKYELGLQRMALNMETALTIKGDP